MAYDKDPSWWPDNSGYGLASNTSAMQQHQIIMEQMRDAMYQQMMMAVPSPMIFDESVNTGFIKETKQNKNKKLLLCKI